MDRLDVYSDVICPWCFIGKQHMQTALKQLEAEGLRFTVTWRPFQLNPDMPEGGLPRDEYRRAKFGTLEKSRQLDAEVARAAEAAGIEIRHDRMQRTPNTLDAHRLIRWAGERGRQDALVDRLFQDYFVDGRDIGDRAVLAEAAAAAGLDPAEARAMLDSDAGRAEVAAEDAAVRRAGLSGVPTFALDNHVLFSGAIPADVFAEALGKARRVIAGRAA
ncbi:MAG: DsbA family oxidoreductase [Acetobacteraceae bacterium]